MNTAERLHRNSHLSVPLAIMEDVRIYKPELTKVLVNRKPKENSDEYRKKDETRDSLTDSIKTETKTSSIGLSTLREKMST